MADKSWIGLFDMKMLKIMLKNSLETEDAGDFALAVDEFDRRKKGDFVVKTVEKFLKKNSTKLGTDFARTLSIFLAGVRIAEKRR